MEVSSKYTKCMEVSSSYTWIRHIVAVNFQAPFCWESLRALPLLLELRLLCCPCQPVSRQHCPAEKLGFLSGLQRLPLFPQFLLLRYVCDPVDFVLSGRSFRYGLRWFLPRIPVAVEIPNGRSVASDQTGLREVTIFELVLFPKYIEFEMSDAEKDEAKMFFVSKNG